ncbi:MAG: GNAT family N-acetyltransferase [Deltaproteobacteria bacterium]
MRTIQHRRPAGVPTGGQFAPTHRPAARSLGLTEHDDEDLDELVPQANSVSKIATVVDAIAAGCVEEPAIAEAIGLSERQGAYYPHAAAALGFVEKTGEHPAEWGLTPAGEKLFPSSALKRTEAIAEAIASDHNVVALIDDGPEALAESWSHLSDTTTARRTATIRSWVEFAYSTSTEEQAALVESQMLETQECSPAIRGRAATRRASALPPERRCPRCNVELPSGSELCDLRGYFTVAPHAVDRIELPSRLARGAPARILAVWLARNLDYRGSGFGSELLLEALDVIVHAARLVGGRLVGVDALDAAAPFYESHDFAPLPNRRDRLALKMSTAARILGIP